MRCHIFFFQWTNAFQVVVTPYSTLMFWRAMSLMMDRENQTETPKIETVGIACLSMPVYGHPS